MARRTGSAPVRGYGLTSWGRAFAAVFESGADHRHLTGARRYFRDHHVDRLEFGRGEITASVRGSQLDPFEVILTPRPLDPQTVVDLLRRTGDVEALLAVARGEQPAPLGELIAPTESADVASACTCPDEAPRCIHALAVAFELSAQIDKQPTTLLRILGTDLPDLLAAVRGRAASPAPHRSGEVSVAPDADFYGDGVRLPAAPSFSRVEALAELNAAALRTALRVSGLGATQLAEALDDLAELYAALHDPR
ncbi:MAG: hypothetical protein WAW85_15060 [Gordonia sp. (in: high G+C Gram-positive bacteria)]|uniref:SWIM zinc finger family protein n=1 Tax=Gordonia sp. (in: high G+C Gram-positive bacteria) TaxID=84139 RepID=UPI003BB56446